MGFRSAYVFVYHTLNSKPPFTFQHWAAPTYSDIPSPSPQMLMQGCHSGLGDIGHEGLKVYLNFSRTFCIAITHTWVGEASGIVSCHLVDFQKCSLSLSLPKARPYLIFTTSFGSLVHLTNAHQGSGAILAIGDTVITKEDKILRNWHVRGSF